MLSTVLSEYLERYAGEEYVFALRHDTVTGSDVVLVLRLMEKSSFKYSYFMDIRESNIPIRVVEYNDGTEKILSNNESSDISDKEEIKKLGRFDCVNMEIIEILGTSNNSARIFQLPLVTMDVRAGDIVDIYMLVNKLENLDKLINEIIDDRITTCLHNKGKY